MDRKHNCTDIILDKNVADLV